MAKNYAVIDPDNLVVENVILADGGFTIDGKVLIQSDSARIGDTYDAESGEFISPPAPLPDLIAYAAQKRWEKEVGGATVGGMAIHTDDRSKSLIMGARMAAEADPDFTTDWKAADGSFITIDAATIVAVSNAVLAHVANCFAIEAQVIDAIGIGTITTTSEIDAAFA